MTPVSLHSPRITCTEALDRFYRGFGVQGRLLEDRHGIRAVVWDVETIFGQHERITCAYTFGLGRFTILSKDTGKQSHEMFFRATPIAGREFSLYSLRYACDVELAEPKPILDIFFRQVKVLLG